MTFAPWQRPSVPATVGNHEDRIKALERRHGAGDDDLSGYIHYGSVEDELGGGQNFGNWVVVVTTGSDPFPGQVWAQDFIDNSGLGIRLHAGGATGTLRLESSSDEVQISAGNDVLIDSVTGDVTVTSDVDINLTPDGVFNFLAAGAGVSVIESEGQMNLGSNNGAATLGAKDDLGLSSANSITSVLLPSLGGTPSDYSFLVGISDGLGGIVPFFRVDNDGSVHILTGTSVISDL